MLMTKRAENVDESISVTERIPAYEMEDFPQNIVVSVSSIIGDRNKQEDYLNYVSRSDESLFVVCDGMGGLKKGELASKEAANSLVHAFYQRVPIENPAEFFKNEAILINNRIRGLREQKNKTDSIDYCGTTIVAAYIKGNQLYWLSIGDSKIYLYRDGKIFALSREHNYRYLIEQGLEEKREGINGNALISFLGKGNLEIMDTNEKPFVLKDEDWILLCTDGITKIFSEQQIGNLLDMCGEEPREAADVIMQTAAEYGGNRKDNCSVITIYYRRETNENSKVCE